MTHLGKKSGNLSFVPFDPMHAENDTTGRAFNQISPIFSNRFLRSTGSFFSRFVWNGPCEMCFN